MSRSPARLRTVWLAVLTALASFAWSALPSFATAAENGRLLYTVIVPNFANLATLDPATGEGQLLTNDGRSACGSYSPDGTMIAFGRTSRAGSSKETIWLMNADGSDRQKLTNPGRGSDSCPSWSPDGTRLVFARETDICNGGTCGLYSEGDIWTIRADGSDGRRLTGSDTDPPLIDPVLSADGSVVYSNTNSRGGGLGALLPETPTLESVEADGTNGRELRLGYAELADFHPVTGAMYYDRYVESPYDSWRTALVTSPYPSASSASELFVPPENAGAWDVAVSAEGSELAFAYDTAAKGVDTRIYVAEITGADPRPISSASGSGSYHVAPDWQPLLPGVPVPPIATEDRLAPVIQRILVKPRKVKARGGKIPARRIEVVWLAFEPAQGSASLERRSESGWRSLAKKAITTSPGRNGLRLSRIGPRRIGSGRYRITLEGEDAAGNRAQPARARLRVVRRAGSGRGSDMAVRAQRQRGLRPSYKIEVG